LKLPPEDIERVVRRACAGIHLSWEEEVKSGALMKFVLILSVVLLTLNFGCLTSGIRYDDAAEDGQHAGSGQQRSADAGSSGDISMEQEEESETAGIIPSDDSEEDIVGYEDDAEDVQAYAQLNGDLGDENLPAVEIDIDATGELVAGSGEPVGTWRDSGAVAQLRLPSPETGATPSDSNASSLRIALERSLAWAIDGLRYYEAGNRRAALRSLTDASILLLEAELPENMQQINILNQALPEQYRKYDLASVLAELQEDRGVVGQMEPDSERAYVEREIIRILAAFGEHSPQDEAIRMFTDETLKYIHYFRDTKRSFFERAYGRKHKYWPMITEIFSSKRIPPELGYVALIESGFNCRAGSHAGAIGIWQFIPGTGKRYGLTTREDFYDPIQATTAASEYILDLIAIFGSPSFLLATAAYNAGENRVMRCLMELDNPFEQRNFWEIRPCLARETQEYVPRVMAAAVIATAPERFGFNVLTEAAAEEAYDVVQVPHVTSLDTIARYAGMSTAELRQINDDLPSTATSTPVSNYFIYVRDGSGDKLARALSGQGSARADAAARQRSTSPEQPAAEQRGSRSSESDAGRKPAAAEPAAKKLVYQARTGDSLSRIAVKYGVTVAQLKEWNPVLKTKVLQKGQKITIYTQVPDQPAARASDKPQQVTHTVQRGESLSKIAEKYGVRQDDLAKWNGLSPPYKVLIGQSLKLYPGRAKAPAKPAPVSYVVQRGNSLSAIAEIFSVTYREIMAWNNLKSGNIKVGQTLVIHPPRPFSVVSYQVKRGDDLSKIARTIGVTTNSILTSNGLANGNRIRRGQQLTIYKPA